MEVWAGLGRLSPAAWACAGFAALAVLGADPAGRRSPPATPGMIGTSEPGGRPIRGPSWLAGRSDGLALGRRLLLGAVAAAGACLAVSRLEGGPGSWAWLAWPLVAGVTAVLLGLLEPRAVRLRRERLIADAPQALDLLAACLAAGMPVRLAGRIGRRGLRRTSG